VEGDTIITKYRSLAEINFIHDIHVDDFRITQDRFQIFLFQWSLHAVFLVPWMFEAGVE